MQHQPPRRRAVDRPPQPFRRDGGESRDRASAVAVRAGRRASRRRAGSRARAADRARARTHLTTQDVAVAVAFLITEIVECAMLDLPRGSDRDLAAPDQRAHRAPDAGQPGPRSRRSRRARQKPSSNASSAGWRSSCAPPSIASWGGTALICLHFRRSNSAAGIVTAAPKKCLPRLGTDFEQGAFCNSDSDLLPPRSRYPIKWARNRQPSPPPVALPGPLLSGAPSFRSLLTGPRGEPRANG